jgi:hypothetical protein
VNDGPLQGGAAREGPIVPGARSSPQVAPLVPGSAQPAVAALLPPLHREASRALVCAFVAYPFVAAALVVVVVTSPTTSPYPLGLVAGLSGLVGSVFAFVLVLAGAIARRRRVAWRLPILALVGSTVAGASAAACTWVLAVTRGGPGAAMAELARAGRGLLLHPREEALTSAMALSPFLLLGAERVVLPPAGSPWRALRVCGVAALAGLVHLLILRVARPQDDRAIEDALGLGGTCAALGLGLLVGDALEERLAAALRRRVEAEA